MDAKKRSHLWRIWSFFCLFFWKHIEIFPHAHPQTQRASPFVSVRHIHTCTLQYMLWFTARAGDLHLSRCVYPSMPALGKIKTTDLCYAEHTRHWHALHQAKESLFSARLLVSASKHSLSSSIFSNLICQRLKKQRQKSGGEKSLPMYCYSCSAAKQNPIWRCLE